VEEGFGADWRHGIQDWELGTGWDVEVLTTQIWVHTWIYHDIPYIKLT
jgi:hypothetical protein